MQIAIMQPYFLPYIGYFQLMSAVDKFVIYDNIKFTKRSWINRNRFLQNGKDVYFSVPLRKDSDFLNVNQRFVSENWNREKLLNQIKAAYRTAPCFEQAFDIFEAAILHDEPNLFEFIRHSLRLICDYLELQTPVVTSSTIEADHESAGQDRVIDICKSVGTDVYVNAIGGQSLYRHDDFELHGLELRFLQSDAIEYTQFDQPFVPWLSVLDVMMFNEAATVNAMLSSYSIGRRWPSTASI